MGGRFMKGVYKAPVRCLHGNSPPVIALDLGCRQSVSKLNFQDEASWEADHQECLAAS